MPVLMDSMSIRLTGSTSAAVPAGVPYREAGVFTANGSGTITAATDDFSEGSTVFTTTSTGTYSIGNDGTGSLSFNSALGTINLAVTLVSTSKVYLVEGDAVLNAGGLAEKQDPTAIAVAPVGTFVFREHDLNATSSVGSVGDFTVAGGIVTAGNKDVNNAGTLTSLTFSGGSFNPPDSATGRGTGTFVDSSPATSSFIYYIVDANNVRFMAGDPGVIGLGRAEMQNGTPALSGSYAFGSEGDTQLPGRNHQRRTLHGKWRSDHCRCARYGARWGLRGQHGVHRNFHPDSQRPGVADPHYRRQQQSSGVDGQPFARVLRGQ